MKSGRFGGHADGTLCGPRLIPAVLVYHLPNASAFGSGGFEPKKALAGFLWTTSFCLTGD